MEKENDYTLFIGNNLERESHFDSAAEAMSFVLQNRLELPNAELCISAKNYTGSVMKLFELKTLEERRKYISDNSESATSVHDIVQNILKKVNKTNTNGKN
jgi:hypothetical protein